MKKVLFTLCICLFLFLLNIFIVPKSFSDELDDLTKKISDLNTALNMSINATAPLESELNNLQSQITDIKSRVAAIDADVTQKKKNIDDGYKNIAEKTAILDQKIRDFYIKSSFNSPLIMFLSSKTASELTQTLAYQKAAADQDKLVITNIALEVVDLEQKKQALENEEARLTVLKASLDDQSAKLDKIVTGAKAYQATLNTQIAQLSARQQELLAQKYASLGIPLYAYSTQGGCSSDINPYKDPGFSGTKFGFFTYGVPNRVGLNQYGAWGRAKAGQSSDQILRAYYNFDSYQNFSGITINVNNGNGINSGSIIWSGSLEDYVKRIYEVPDSWTDNGLAALKAQAIAARSYVLAATNNGGESICANQNCQVFQTNPKGGNWDAAVNQTSGQVMVQGGQPIKAWFSSTHGGYVHSSADIGWSGTSFTKNAQDASGSINSFSDLNNNAYDKDSPWFYCDWGSRSQDNNTAWLTSAEVADIANVIMLAQKDSSTQPHLSQPDKSNPDGTDTWDADKVKQELGSGAFSSVSNISISADFGSGKTTTVTISGDGGSKSFDGDTFKNYFNLRAPSNIQIVGPLYNIEQR